jgi:hypothetical protein
MLSVAGASWGFEKKCYAPNQNFDFTTLENKYREVFTYLPATVGNDTLNFFLDSFKRQDWHCNQKY